MGCSGSKGLRHAQFERRVDVVNNAKVPSSITSTREGCVIYSKAESIVQASMGFQGGYGPFNVAENPDRVLVEEYEDSEDAESFARKKKIPLNVRFQIEKIEDEHSGLFPPIHANRNSSASSLTSNRSGNERQLSATSSKSKLSSTDSGFGDDLDDPQAISGSDKTSVQITDPHQLNMTQADQYSCIHFVDRDEDSMENESPQERDLNLEEGFDRPATPDLLVEGHQIKRQSVLAKICSLPPIHVVNKSRGKRGIAFDIILADANSTEMNKRNMQLIERPKSTGKFLIHQKTNEGYDSTESDIITLPKRLKKKVKNMRRIKTAEEIEKKIAQAERRRLEQTERLHTKLAKAANRESKVRENCKSKEELSQKESLEKVEMKMQATHLKRQRHFERLKERLRAKEEHARKVREAKERSRKVAENYQEIEETSELASKMTGSENQEGRHLTDHYKIDTLVSLDPTGVISYGET
eukprot:Nk52_evm122s352 gene=Nk52_evmTU122s352